MTFQNNTTFLFKASVFTVYSERIEKELYLLFSLKCILNWYNYQFPVNVCQLQAMEIRLWNIGLLQLI